MKHPSAFESIDPRNPHDVLTHRAKRLVTFLENPATPKQIVAEEIFLIFKAGIAYCGRCLGVSFWKWMLDASNHTSICDDCTAEKNKAGTCSSCKNVPITH